MCIMYIVICLYSNKYLYYSKKHFLKFHTYLNLFQEFIHKNFKVKKEKELCNEIFLFCNLWFFLIIFLLWIVIRLLMIITNYLKFNYFAANKTICYIRNN